MEDQQNRKMMRKISWIWFVGLMLWSSCGEQPHFEKVYSFNGKKWSQDVKPDFKVKIDDVSVPYAFTINLRTTTDYKYNNLWIFLKTETPDGTIERLPFQIMVANPDGSWVGTKTGTIVESALEFQARMMPVKGEYTFTIEQGITASEVDEVLDIGFRVRKVSTPEAN
jgi:gliding motility-associated lipoprotein GldH